MSFEDDCRQLSEKQRALLLRLHDAYVNPPPGMPLRARGWVPCGRQKTPTAVSLVRRGLARRSPNGPFYRITVAGSVALHHTGDLDAAGNLAIDDTEAPPPDVAPPVEQRASVVASNDPSMPAGTIGTMTTRFVVGKDGEPALLQSFRRDVGSAG